VWGTFRNEHDYTRELKMKTGVTAFPDKPGVFALQYPYEGTLIVIDKRCPAQFVNDAKGVNGASNNIEFPQHQNPRMLAFDKMKGLQLLLQARVIKDIAAGEQLFFSYGDPFWEEDKAINWSDEPVKDHDISNAPSDAEEDSDEDMKDTESKTSRILTDLSKTARVTMKDTRHLEDMQQYKSDESTDTAGEEAEIDPDTLTGEDAKKDPDALLTPRSQKPKLPGTKKRRQSAYGKRKQAAKDLLEEQAR
jgi:hypothetical protein